MIKWITTTRTKVCSSLADTDVFNLENCRYLRVSKTTTQSAANGQTNGQTVAKNMRTVIHLSLRDSLPAYGPIASMTFSLGKNVV